MKKLATTIAVTSILGVVSTSAAATTLSVGAGSFFGMEVAPGFVLETPVTGNDGIVVGTSQEALGSHGGAPDGSETPGIDNPWSFFSNTGMHETKSDANILSVSGNQATIDLSGWYVDWNGVEINMGGGAHAGNADGVGNITCSSTCVDGDTYVLDYSATVPDDGSTNFGNVKYTFHAEGTITGGNLEPIPVPAAVWLFGSGLIGLIGVARRKQA